MRCRACQRPTGSKGLNHTRPGFLEQTQLQSVTLHFLHVLRGWTGRREEARKARESERERESFCRREATLSSSWPDDDASTGRSPEPQLP